MTDYQKYINALRKCAKEHDNDRTSFAHIRVSDLCRDTAILLEEVEKEPKSEWIPLKTRPMTDEESTYYRDWAEYGAEMFDCPLPDDGQEVLISCGGYVCTDVFARDDADGCYFEGVEIDDVEAWMPLPKPYRTN